MALEKDEKTSIIADYQMHSSDTGSPQVQVALLTERINGVDRASEGASA